MKMVSSCVKTEKGELCYSSSFTGLSKIVSNRRIPITSTNPKKKIWKPIQHMKSKVAWMAITSEKICKSIPFSEDMGFLNLPTLVHEQTDVRDQIMIRVSLRYPSLFIWSSEVPLRSRTLLQSLSLLQSKGGPLLYSEQLPRQPHKIYILNLEVCHRNIKN